MMIRKRKDKEEEDNHDDIDGVNDDKDTPSKSTEKRDNKIVKTI